MKFINKKKKDKKNLAQKSASDILNNNKLKLKFELVENTSSVDEIKDQNNDHEDNKIHLDKISKKAVKVAFIILIAMLSVVIFNHKDEISSDQILDWVQNSFSGLNKGPGFPCDIRGNQVSAGNFQVMNNTLISVSDTSFVALNDSAHEIANRQHSFSNPILKTSGNKALIYNLYGTGFQIELRSKSIYKNNVQNNILTGAIANNGVYALVTESNGFLCEMTVYSGDGQKQNYKYCFSDYLITDLSFSYDGKSIAAVGISAQDGAMKSAVFVFDYKSNEPKVKVEYEDNMMLGLKYLDNGNIIAVGNKLSSLVYSKDGKTKNYDYNKKTLTAFDIHKSEGVFLSFSKTVDGNSCEIHNFKNDGKAEMLANTDLSVISLSYQSERLAVLGDHKVICYNLYGDKKGEWEVSTDCRAVKIVKNKAYLLGISRISNVKI